MFPPGPFKYLGDADNETVRLIGANCVSTLDYVNENNRGNKQASAVQSTQTSSVQSSQSNQGIQGVTSADQQDVQDTYMEILFEDALKLIKKYGFKLAYTKTYRGEVAGQQTDTRFKLSIELCIGLEDTLRSIYYLICPYIPIPTMQFFHTCITI